VFHEGRLMLRSANAPLEAMVPQALGLRSGFETVAIDGAQWRVFASHGAQSDVQVYVGERVDSRDAILHAVLRSVAWPMALALPVLVLAMWLAVRVGVAPLRELGRMLARREPQRLEPVDMPRAPLEMAPLLDALNRLFARIAAMIETERRFTADAAHELRTPIAAIRAQAQVALTDTDDASRRQALRNTIKGCDRAARLAEQLLTLSRLETGTAPTMDRLDLAALARRVLAEIGPRAIERRQRLELDAPTACPVTGNDVLVAVLVRNLVDNALRYSPDGARIVVHVTCRDGRAVLQVGDSGPGMSAADRAHLGERFFRVLGSGQSGSGLGWSIARRIAAVHGADIGVDRSAELGGLAVTVRWPAVR
jgi:two-component system sensor histidine kinase QseC